MIDPECCCSFCCLLHKEESNMRRSTHDHPPAAHIQPQKCVCGAARGPAQESQRVGLNMFCHTGEWETLKKNTTIKFRRCPMGGGRGKGGGAVVVPRTARLEMRVRRRGGWRGKGGRTGGQGSVQVSSLIRTGGGKTVGVASRTLWEVWEYGMAAPGSAASGVRGAKGWSTRACVCACVVACFA